MPYQRTTNHPKRGIPVYDEQGALFAQSLSAAARCFNCRPEALHWHAVEYADGYQLISRPRPARCGPRTKDAV